MVIFAVESRIGHVRLTSEKPNFLVRFQYWRYCSCPFHLYVLFSVKTSVAEIAQLGERQTEDLKVPGSNPESSYEL